LLTYNNHFIALESAPDQQASLHKQALAEFHKALDIGGANEFDHKLLHHLAYEYAIVRDVRSVSRLHSTPTHIRSTDGRSHGEPTYLQIPKALHFAQRAVDTNLCDPKSFVLLALVHTCQKSYSEALAIVNIALRHHPGDVMYVARLLLAA